MRPLEDGRWPGPACAVKRGRLALLCGLREDELDELVDYGFLPPPQSRLFRGDLIAPLREAARVRDLYDLDLFTAGLLVQYLHRIARLEDELHALRRPPHPACNRDGPSPWHEPHA